MLNLGRLRSRRALPALACAAFALSLAGCTKPSGFEGAWAYGLNGHPGIERYLFVERAGRAYLVALVDRARGELEGMGEAELEGGRLVARMGGGAALELELAGDSELRAFLRKPRQAEDLSFAFFRAGGEGAGVLP